MSKGILYYSHNTLDGTLLNDACRISLIASGLPITSVTHKTIDFGNNIVVSRLPSLCSMFKNIIDGLEAMTEEYVFLVEHDCLYHSSHFDFDSGHITYNTNMWRLCPGGYHKCPDIAPVLSACMGPHKQLLRAMKEKLRITIKVGKNMMCEPGRGGDGAGRIIDYLSFESKEPCIDVRHTSNTSGCGWLKHWKYKQMLPYWGNASVLKRKLKIQ